MPNDWLNQEFEKAAKEASAFPRWIQDAIRIESMKSVQAVQYTRPPETDANSSAKEAERPRGDAQNDNR